MSRAVTLGSMILILIGLGACGRAKSTTEMPLIADCRIEGLANCRRVGEDLLFAGQPTPLALAELARLGYRTVLSTRGAGELSWDEQALADSLGLTFVSIPMPNPVEGIQDAWVDRFDELMRENPRPAVLHCSSGNRVAGLWGVWLAERQGIDPEQALAMAEKAGMTRIRPVVEARLGVRPAAWAPAPASDSSKEAR